MTTLIPVGISGTGMNRLVINRLSAIQNILKEASSGGGGMASSSIGAERESFINLVLNNVIAPPYRIGTGEITDPENRQSGQVDVVIEYTGSMSFPLLRGDTSRLYLAEGVCAVIEIKSNIKNQWGEVVEKARLVKQLTRNINTMLGVLPKIPDKIPFFAVGYTGWTKGETVERKLLEQTQTDAEVDGILVIDRGIYRGREGKGAYSGHGFDGPAALYGFLLSIEQLTSSMIAAKPGFITYVK